MIAMMKADPMKALKSEIAIGIVELNRGDFQTYDEAGLAQLANDICRRGRIRLNALRLKVAAKVQRKK
jgi:hypothetical protein